MANKIILKKSAVGGKAPLVADLDYGELAVNYADGKLYYKNSSNSIDSIPSATATATLTNKTLSAPNVTGLATFTGEVLINNAGGIGGTSEGGELHLAIPSANSTLSGPIAIDIYQNKIRFFETTGTNRGAYIDLTTAQTNAGTNLLTGGSGGGTVTVIGRAAPVNIVASNNTLVVYSRSGSVNVAI